MKIGEAICVGCNNSDYKSQLHMRKVEFSGQLLHCVQDDTAWVGRFSLRTESLLPDVAWGRTLLRYIDCHAGALAVHVKWHFGRAVFVYHCRLRMRRRNRAGRIWDLIKPGIGGGVHLQDVVALGY